MKKESAAVGRVCTIRLECAHWVGGQQMEHGSGRSRCSSMMRRTGDGLDGGGARWQGGAGRDNQG